MPNIFLSIIFPTKEVIESKPIYRFTINDKIIFILLLNTINILLLPLLISLYVNYKKLIYIYNSINMTFCIFSFSHPTHIFVFYNILYMYVSILLHLFITTCFILIENFVTFNLNYSEYLSHYKEEQIVIHNTRRNRVSVASA